VNILWIVSALWITCVYAVDGLLVCCVHPVDSFCRVDNLWIGWRIAVMACVPSASDIYMEWQELGG